MMAKLEKRIEEKLVFPKLRRKYLNKFFSDGFEYIFPSRQISSVYYENINFDIYKDSVEGVVLRKKLEYVKNLEIFISKKIKPRDGKYKIFKKEQ